MFADRKYERSKFLFLNTISDEKSVLHSSEWVRHETCDERSRLLGFSGLGFLTQWKAIRNCYHSILKIVALETVYKAALATF